MHCLLQLSLGWSPSALGRKTSESKTVQPVLYSVHFHMFTSLQYSDIFTGCLSEPKFPIRLHVSVSTPSPFPPLLISLTFYICTFLLDLFTLVPTPASSKFHSISARQMVIMLSLTLILLPLHFRNASTIETFKSALKDYLFNLQEFDQLISA